MNDEQIETVMSIIINAGEARSQSLNRHFINSHKNRNDFFCDNKPYVCELFASITI